LRHSWGAISAETGFLPLHLAPMVELAVREVAMAYRLAFDVNNRLLLVSATGNLTREDYLAGHELIERFMATAGPCSAIVDLSAVERFDLTTQFAREIGKMRPAIPVGMKRVVVAPQPAIYGTARLVATLREGTGGELILTQSIAEACARLGIESPEFAPVP
jgi:hypothetical protein